MRKCVFFIFLCFPFIVFSQKFDIQVIQNAEIIEKNSDNEYILQNSSFDLVFSFVGNINLLVNASFNDETYWAALNKISLNNLKGFRQTGIAEGLDNQKFEMFISDNAPNAWFFQDEDYKRFNKVVIKDSKIFATRTIENLYDLDKDKRIKINNFEGNIFIVAVFYEFDSNNLEKIEYQREILKLVIINKMKSPFLGLRTVTYQVNNLEKAKQWYSKVFEIEPYFDESFYVGFNIGGFELGLIPAQKNKNKNSGVITYWGVEDINEVYENLISNGAKPNKEPHSVGDKIMAASVIDPWGNIIGIIFNPNFKLN